MKHWKNGDLESLNKFRTFLADLEQNIWNEHVERVAKTITKHRKRRDIVTQRKIEEDVGHEQVLIFDAYGHKHFLTY